MVGHSSASGSPFFRGPALELYVSGTVDQIRTRMHCYDLSKRLAMALPSAWRG